MPSLRISKKFLFAFGVAFFWAISIIITKFILKEGENTYNLVFWTILLASPYWIYVFSKNIEEFKTASKKSYWILIGMGLIGTLAINIVEMFAIKYSQVINYSFLIRSVTLFTIIFAFIFLGEKITWKKILVTIFILVGAYFLTTNGKIIHLTSGDIFTLIEAMLISFGNTILGKMATNRMSSSLSSSAGSIIAVIPMALIAWFTGSIALPKAPILLVALTIFGILGTTCRFKSYKLNTASYATMIASFTPVLVSFMAIPFLKESLSPIQLIGGLLIIFATILVGKFKI